MDTIKISTDLLSRITGLSKDELSGQLQTEGGELKDNHEETLKTLYGDRLSKIKKEQWNRGLREKGESIEKALKDLFLEHQIDSERAEDGIKELTDKLKSSGGNGSTEPNKMTLQEIKSLPEVQDWLASEVQALKDRSTELETSLTKKDSTIHQLTVVNTAIPLGLKHLTGANAIGANVGSVEMQLKALGTKNLKLSEDGKDIIVLGSDGEPLKDNLHSPVTYEQYMVDNWKSGFSEKPAGSGSPNYKPGQGGGSAKITITSEEHYNEQLKNAGDDRSKKSEIRRAYASYLREKEK